MVMLANSNPNKKNASSNKKGNLKMGITASKNKMVWINDKEIEENGNIRINFKRDKLEMLSKYEYLKTMISFLNVLVKNKD